MKHKASLGYFCIALIALLLSVPVTKAQSETATILGTVRDANGAAVVGAKVSLKNIATSITASTVTSDSGDYQFVNVKIGDYQIIVEASGFNRTIADRINLTVSSRQRVDIALEVASAEVAVTVTGAAELLETESSDKGQVIQRKQIVALPLNGRSYANLALLAPGVRESSTNSPAGGGGREAAFNVNGLRATVNNFLLDGIDNNAYGTSNQSFSSQVVQVSPDAIAEFKVQTNTYSAEFGRAGGAVINATYRMGVSSQHRTQRGGLLQTCRRNETAAHPESIWLYVRRSDNQRPYILLRRLRRLPSDTEEPRLLNVADARTTARDSLGRRAQPDHRCIVRRGDADPHDRLCAHGAQ